MPNMIDEHTEISNWDNFTINHGKLNGKTIKQHLKSSNESYPNLSINGVYCYSAEYKGVRICLRIGTAFGNKSSILKRLECHKNYEIKETIKSATRRKTVRIYKLFFNDIFGSTDLTIHYKPLLNYKKEQLLELEKKLITLYLPVWEFPFEGIGKEPDRLLEFGIKAQEYAEKKI